jgi:hypothetical protein
MLNRDVTGSGRDLLLPAFIEFSRNEESLYRGADKSLARLGRKQATAPEDFDVHISYL